MTGTRKDFGRRSAPQEPSNDTYGDDFEAFLSEAKKAGIPVNVGTDFDEAYPSTRLSPAVRVGAPEWPEEDAEESTGVLSDEEEPTGLMEDPAPSRFSSTEFPAKAHLRMVEDSHVSMGEDPNPSTTLRPRIREAFAEVDSFDAEPLEEEQQWGTEAPMKDSGPEEPEWGNEAPKIPVGDALEIPSVFEVPFPETLHDEEEELDLPEPAIVPEPVRAQPVPAPKPKVVEAPKPEPVPAPKTTDAVWVREEPKVEEDQQPSRADKRRSEAVLVPSSSAGSALMPTRSSMKAQIRVVEQREARMMVWGVLSRFLMMALVVATTAVIILTGFGWESTVLTFVTGSMLMVELFGVVGRYRSAIRR